MYRRNYCEEWPRITFYEVENYGEYIPTVKEKECNKTS